MTGNIYVPTKGHRQLSLKGIMLSVPVGFAVFAVLNSYLSNMRG